MAACNIAENERGQRPVCIFSVPNLCDSQPDRFKKSFNAYIIDVTVVPHSNSTLCNEIASELGVVHGTHR